MRFKRTRNVEKWTKFYERYLQRKTVHRKSNIKLWVGKQSLKSCVVIGISIKNPTIAEFQHIYKRIKDEL